MEYTQEQFDALPASGGVREGIGRGRTMYEKMEVGTGYDTEALIEMTDLKDNGKDIGSNRNTIWSAFNIKYVKPGLLIKRGSAYFKVDPASAVPLAKKE